MYDMLPIYLITSNNPRRDVKMKLVVQRKAHTVNNIRQWFWITEIILLGASADSIHSSGNILTERIILQHLK